MLEQKEDTRIVSFGNLIFPQTCLLANYDIRWCPTFTDRMLINVMACFESTILFAARERWINSSAPVCTPAG